MLEKKIQEAIDKFETLSIMEVDEFEDWSMVFRYLEMSIMAVMLPLFWNNF